MLNYFEFKPVVQEEISDIDIAYLQLWWQFCSVEQNYFANFGRV